MTDCQPIPDERRRQIFLALVEAQDRRMSVLQSRALMAQQFSLTDTQLRQIEHEGLVCCWPPL
jgi:hypothetical protein